MPPTDVERRCLLPAPIAEYPYFRAMPARQRMAIPSVHLHGFGGGPGGFMDDGGNPSGASADELADLRRQNEELRRLCSHLTDAATLSRDREMTWVFALEGNQDGVWDWNIVTSEVFFSVRWKEMLGFSDDEISGNLAEWSSRVHPDDIDQVYVDINAHLSGAQPFYRNEHRMQCRDGSWKWILDRGRIVAWTDDGRPLRMVGTHSDISVRKEAELEREHLLAALRDADGHIKVLSGLLPICAWCKKIRDEQGEWTVLEAYLCAHSAADFSHGICPACRRQHCPEVLGPA